MEEMTSLSKKKNQQITHLLLTVNAEILVCRKFGDYVGNRLELKSILLANFLIWHLWYGCSVHYVRSCSINIGAFLIW